MRSVRLLVLFALVLQFTMVPAVVGKTSDEKRIEKLIKDLQKSRDGSVRSNAAWDLGTLGAIEAVPALTGALKDSSSAVRANAATSLGKLGDAAKSAIPAIRELLNDSDLSVVASAAWSLEKHGIPASDLIEAYSHVLEAPSCKVRLRGAWGLLGEVAPQQIFYVALVCSREPDLDTKIDAGKLLRKLMDPKDKTMIPTILDAMKSSGDVEQNDLISAISAYKPPVTDAIPLLDNLLNSSIALNRAAAARALGRYGKDSIESVPLLIKVLQYDNDLDVREAAAKSLGDLGSIAKSAVPALMEIAENDKWPRIRAAAMSALGEMRQDAKAAIPILKKAYEDPDRNISNSARNALFRIDPDFKASQPKPGKTAESSSSGDTGPSGEPLFSNATALGGISEKGQNIGEMTIYKDFALITVADSQSPVGWSQYTYRKGAFTGPTAFAVNVKKVTPVKLIDFSIIAKMTKEAPGLLESPDSPISHVIFKGNGKKGTWMVYVGEGMVQKGYVTFKLDGKVSGKKKF